MPVRLVRLVGPVRLVRVVGLVCLEVSAVKALKSVNHC